MVGITIKRSFATVAVLAGLLAVAAPAGACTRMAKADYCAVGITDGASNTLQIGEAINPAGAVPARAGR